MVKPADWRFPVEVYVPHEQFGGASDGENVLVRLLDEAPSGEHPRGKVVVCLSKEGSLDTDLQTIQATYDLPGELPGAVLSEADAIEATRDGLTWPDRVDLRGLQVFTIDPSDAQDFDDAISLEQLPSGKQRLGVHIADVSHYVKAGTRLDREAECRGTSIYLPGQVIPMLPERLSNDLCSLRPGEDRLTKTVRMTFSSSGDFEQTEVFRSVIHSQRRFTYDEALAMLENVDGHQATVPPDLAPFEKTLQSMAILRDRMVADRIERGALQLDIPKLRLLLDEAGNVEGLGQDTRDAAHSLIEAFMLSANEAVASYFVSKKLPLVARVHPLPDEEKLKDFKSFVEALGLRFAGRGGSHELQDLIKQVEGEPFSPVVQLGLLRTMGHAEYTSGAGLHFALATNFYCHFTSPIRRYPDLLVHRALDDHFDGTMAKATHRREWDSELPQAAESASKLERRAEEAEREMITLRLVRYLQGLVGEEMEACIVSMHPFGFFVRDEETLIEGLVHVATLGDDYYEFDPEKLTLEGRRKGRRFAVGDRLRVELAEADPEARQISFRLVGKKQKK
jgi:ribonuclease R